MESPDAGMLYTSHPQGIGLSPGMYFPAHFLQPPLPELTQNFGNGSSNIGWTNGALALLETKDREAITTSADDPRISEKANKDPSKRVHANMKNPKASVQEEKFDVGAHSKHSSSGKRSPLLSPALLLRVSNANHAAIENAVGHSVDPDSWFGPSELQSNDGNSLVDLGFG